MSKRPYSFTFTYSRRNSDVRELIEDKKKNKGFCITDYMCEAVRFYEKNNSKIASGLNEDDVRRIVGSLLANTEALATIYHTQAPDDDRTITTSLDINNLSSVKDSDLDED